MSFAPVVPDHLDRGRANRARMRMPLLGIGLATAILLPSTLVPSVEADSAGVNVTLDSWVGGQVRAVAIAGTTAFIGVGRVIEIVDLSNATAPILTGMSPPFDADVVDLAVTGNLVLAAHHTGLAILDVSDPTNPRVVADDENAYAVGVARMSDRAYVVCADGSLRIIDLSNPGTPSETSQIQVAKPQATAGVAHAVVAGRRLYVSMGGTPQTIDVADPDRPGLIGPIGDAEATVWAANNGYAYVTESPTYPQGERGPKIGGGLDVVDVSDPPNPVVVGSLETGPGSGGATLIGTTFYASEGDKLVVIDVGEPTQPTLLQIIPLAGVALASEGHFAVLCSPGDLSTPNGFHVLDVSDPATPVALAFPRTLSGGYHVALDGSYAYVATLAGFFTVDLSDPHQARQTGVYGPDDAWCGPAIDGTIGYVPWKSGDLNHPEWGLRVLDLTDPTQPRDVGFAPTAGIPHQAAVVGHHLYVVQSRTHRHSTTDSRSSKSPTRLGLG